ncbi:MAG: hypothetical protein IJI49_00375 [Bacilli bacterium]|nr:hypothetical protein [Bacilli bacterium]
MDIYEEFKNIKDKALFFKKISNYSNKIELWNKLSSSEKKGLISRLSIEDIKILFNSLNSIERKECYQLFDDKKLTGYYKSLSKDEQKRMTSELSDIEVNKNIKKGEIKEEKIKEEKIVEVNDKEGVKKVSSDIDNKGNVSFSLLVGIVLLLLLMIFFVF